MRHISDRILGLAGLATAAVVVWQGEQIQESFIQDPLGPRAFPYVVAAVIVIASLAIILRPSSAPQWPRGKRLLAVAAAVIVLVAYAELLPRAGFVLSTALAAAFLSWQLGARPRSAVIAGVGISVGIYVLFQLVLGLSLARGPWGF